MPRALWSGSISFGLVNIPVRLLTAVHEHKLQFHMAHEPDSGPIGYQKICKLEDKPVPDDEIIRVYEDRGELVEITDEDLESVQVKGVHTIELSDFVPYEEIDPTFFSHTYLVAPDKDAERPYALLAKAMESSGLAGVGTFVMRNREYLGVLRVRKGALTLEQMYFADEVDAPETALPDKLPSVPKRELDMALSLVESLSGKWKPEKYADSYRAALEKVVRAKRQGKEVRRAPEPEEQAPPDLMEALRASLETRTGKGKTKQSGRRKTAGASQKKSTSRPKTSRSRSKRAA
jgi:DNA end-binding protein Ku